ncbi:FHA domain-containing protein [Skeletonema marinoi]|uniref:FHA domain-containing protein n=1 Tax=Skeletonema marinoi TaxID=267567 RepID=A0AAD8YBV4_9STRA|nr:FHA domain-containing protein [Skeletonema marinoi]
MTSWKPPSWSQIPPPSQQWHLDELKNGNLIASHSLNNLLSSSSNNNRHCITFGRIDDPTQIDILTAHESCSRLHARIAFTATGAPYLKDLGSGNGTFVNNRQLPIEACGKWECTDSTKKEVEVRGSRGVVVYPGDAIRLGCSTRIFVLEGPEEFERGAVKLKEAEKKMTVVDGHDNDSDAAAAATVEKNEEACTWGMSYSDDEHEAQHQNQQQLPLTSQSSNNTTNLPSIDTFFSSTPSSKYTISNPLQQLYNQYQTKSYKLDAISTESKRISQKEDMGVELTEGQRNQLTKNQDKLTALETSLKGLKDKIEEGMHVAIYGKPLNRQFQRSKGDGYDRDGDDDVDDFFDRTTTRQRDNDHGEEVESEASLIEKWKVLLQSHSKQQTVVASTTKQCDNLQSQIDSAGDEEDAFFIQNDLNLVKDNVKKATCRLDDIENDLKDVERLLKIVNPKLSWDREGGLIGTDFDIDEKKTKYKASESDNATTNAAEEQNESIMMMPPPPKTAATLSTVTTSFDMPPPPIMMATAAAKSAVSSFDMMPPPPKVTKSAPETMSNAAEQEVVTEHPVNPDRATPKEETEQPSPPPLQRKKRQLGPMRPPQTAAGTQGTLAALKQFTSHSNEASNNSHHAKKQKKSNDNSKFDPRKDEWNAPSDQDGSGRTSLHDKFKGRY